MIEHLSHLGNCHGEWAVIGGAATGIPLLGYIVTKTTVFGRKAKAAVGRVIGFKPRCSHTCEDHK